jgi:hypothetical protein
MGRVRLKHYLRLAIFLAFAVAAQFCFLNPQPEPPAGDKRTTGAGGTGGRSGTDAGAGGTGLPPIEPPRDGGGIGISDASSAGDAARSDVGTDAPTDGGAPDGEDGATDAGDEPDVLEDANDADDADDAIDAATDAASDPGLDTAINGDTGIAEGGDARDGAPQP